MAAKYRLTHAARDDVVTILESSQDRFGDDARERYAALIVTAIQDAAERGEDASRPELGEGVFVWHLVRGRARVVGEKVHRPRHFLVCRREGDVVVVIRVLHDAMDLPRHIDSAWTAE